MAEIDLIRELHCYEKMYHLLQKTVIDCAEICKDPIVKEKLIKIQQDAEDIYTGDEGKTLNYLTTDEKIIALLLTFIREREISKELGQMNSDVVSEALDWNLALTGVKIKLTDEMIKAQINKIFHPENKEKDSGQ